MNGVRSTRFLLAIAAGLIVLSCTADRIGGPADGALRIFFAVDDQRSKEAAGTVPESAVLDAPQVDTILVVIRDARDREVAARRVGYSGSGGASFDLTLPASRDLTVLMSGESAGIDDERGTLYYGEESGVRVERGRTTEATLLLSRTESGRPVVDGEAGSPSYLVRWNRIPFATSYTLRESSAGGSQDFTIAGEDTFRLFAPGVENGNARPAAKAGVSRRGAGRDVLTARAAPAGLARDGKVAAAVEDLRSYRVRGILPLGPGVFGDSAEVDLSAWFDLPRVFDVIPDDGATGILDTSEISIRFDRAMDQTASIDTLVTLRELSNGELVPIVHDWYESLVLTPLAPLRRGEWFRVRVSTKVRDLEGRPLDQDPSIEGLQAFVSDFRVEEYDPLRVLAVTPPDAAVDVPIADEVSLSLNRAVDRASVTSTSFTLTGPSGPVATTWIPGAGDTILRLIPSDDLLYETDYTVRLETEVIDAARGEPLDQDPSDETLQPFVSTFRTIAQPIGPSILSTTPVGGETNHPVYDPAVIVFDSEIRTETFRPGETVFLQRDLNDLWVNVELRSAPYTTDGRTFTLVPVQDLRRKTDHRLIVRGGPDGVRGVDGVPFDRDYTSPGFQDFEAPFVTEQNIRVESSYPENAATQVPWDVEVRLSLDGPIQSESVADTTFGLRLDGAPVAGSRWISSDLREIRFRPDAALLGYRTYTVWVGTGLRAAGGGSFDQDYSLDGHQGFMIQFTTVEETVPPRVESVVPPDGALDVSPGQRITVAFSEPVRSFLVPDNFYITRTDSAGARVNAVVTVGADNLSAELVPISPLASLTVYHVHVEPLLTDLFGNGLDQDPAQPGRQKFHSVFTTERERIPPQVAAIAPADRATGVPVSGAVTIDFTEPVDESSVGSALRIGTGSHPHPGGITLENGGQRVRWTPTLPLLFSSSYEVRVDTLLTDLAGNRLDQYPDGEHPGSDPFVSTFSTESDLQGPVLQSVTPEDGSIGVSVSTAPVLRFSEALDPITIGPTGIGLTDSLGQEVATASVLSADGREVTLGHALPLEFEMRYSITIFPGLTDLQGNPFDSNPESPGDQSLTTFFRTQVETIPPTVVSVVPAESATRVAISADVTVTFSEPCDPSTVDASSFRLLRSGISVAGLRDVAPDGMSATLTPDSSLHYATLYEVRVEGVTDARGNLLDQDPVTAGDQAFVSTFMTADEPAPSPMVMSVAPADGSIDVNPAVHPRIVFSRAMDVTSFTPGTLGWLRPGGFLVSAVAVAEPGDSSFVLTPPAPFVAGPYAWFVSLSLKDTQGNGLDQDPALPGSQYFTSGFEVGKRPVPSAGAGVCSDGVDLAVPFDGSASVDPDGQIAHVTGTWSWGDGTTTAISDSAGLRTTHTYACADAKGCDGIDNDGDGETDEAGPGGCDESYRVILRLKDESGLEAADTTGVAFCAFMVRSSDPNDGATEVDTLLTLRLRLTAPCDPATLGPASVRLVVQGGDSAAVVRATEDGHRVLVLDPEAPLLPDTIYEIHVGSLLRAATGAGLDSEPCEAGDQEFIATFRTQVRPESPPGIRKVRPASARVSAGRPQSPIRAGAWNGERGR